MLLYVRCQPKVELVQSISPPSSLIKLQIVTSLLTNCSHVTEWPPDLVSTLSRTRLFTSVRKVQASAVVNLMIIHMGHLQYCEPKALSPERRLLAEKPWRRDAPRKLSRRLETLPFQPQAGLGSREDLVHFAKLRCLSFISFV